MASEQAPAVLLGYDPMDRVHEEFAQVVQHALHCADDELLAALDVVDAHLRSHFGAEDGWMRETGFPAADCHIDEHAAVLRSSDQVRPRVANGDFALGRSFVAELALWFPGHADYLDSALAAWMCKRQYGGKPVVLHRKAPPA